MNVNDQLFASESGLCCTCLRSIDSSDESIDINNCSGIESNSERKELLSSIFAAISITIVLNDSSKLYTICRACDGQITALLDFLETCIQSQLFLKQQIIKTEVEPVDVLSFLASVEPIDNDASSEESSDTWFQDVPLNNEPNFPKKEKALKYQCSLCPRTFKSPLFLTNHSYKHTGDPPHSCSHCPEKFRSLKRLKQHINGVHRNFEAICCSLCSVGFNSEELLRKHELKEHDNNLFKCAECLQELEDLTALKTHEEQHSYNCWLCNVNFDDRDIWLEHWRNHSHPMKQYPCFCGKSFNRNVRLAEHKAFVHGNRDIRKFHCNECGRKFSNRHNLNHHINVHKGLKPFQCNMCPQTYHYPSGLQQHIRRVHSLLDHVESNRFLCDTCGKSFSRKAHLQRHFFRRHTPDAPRNFPCEVCGKAFKDRDSRRNHSLLHSAEKSVSCETCGKMFLKRSAMQAHANRVHLGLRPFPCSSCDSRFKMKAHLEKHMRVHTGEKPFACTMCPYACAEKSNLQKHIKIHYRTR